VRVVLDTNVVVSGLLWPNTPRRVLDAVRAGKLTAFTSQTLLDELADVLARPHLAPLIARFSTPPAQLVFGYSKLARVVNAAAIAQVVLADPDDDAVFAAAVAARAELIVSGDKRVREIKNYQGIEVVSAAEVLARVEA
jgi:putative PIN family toxin of toxin-antitoxin system